MQKKCGHWQGPKKIIPWNQPHFFFHQKNVVIDKDQKKSSNFILNFYPQISPILDVFFFTTQEQKKNVVSGTFFFHDAGAKKNVVIDRGQKKIIPHLQRGLDTHRHLFLVSQPHFFFHQKNVVIDRDQKKIMPWNQRGLDPHRHLSLMADIYSLCLLYFFC